MQLNCEKSADYFFFLYFAWKISIEEKNKCFLLCLFLLIIYFLSDSMYCSIFFDLLSATFRIIYAFFTTTKNKPKHCIRSPPLSNSVDKTISFYNCGLFFYTLSVAAISLFLFFKSFYRLYFADGFF